MTLRRARRAGNDHRLRMRLARPRSLDGRWFPTALALVLVAGQGATLAHLAIVRHAYCAEHGELVDVGAESSAPTPASPEDATDHVLPGPASGSDGHEHEHCAVVGHRREAVLADRVGPAVTLHAPVEPAPPADVVVVAVGPVFRLAPKQSPPA